jgi:hypothetical protein
MIIVMANLGDIENMMKINKNHSGIMRVLVSFQELSRGVVYISTPGMSAFLDAGELRI